MGEQLSPLRAWEINPIIPRQWSLSLLKEVSGHPHCQDSALSQASSSPDLLRTSPGSPCPGRVQERRKATDSPTLPHGLRMTSQLEAGHVAGPARLLGLGESSKAERRRHRVVEVRRHGHTAQSGPTDILIVAHCRDRC
ncbi:hypothetical protein P7K49_028935 [Saguinus oedipus]|uniref:Uncharacterized protein n=1 Tax=Saguinus oedipus TaxID=9490 RepID=A0ABQ9U7U9_SAGOE|nr:hypothetical protein P7K49_028935 [Saguinus oedipus]